MYVYYIQVLQDRKPKIKEYYTIDIHINYDTVYDL